MKSWRFLIIIREVINFQRFVKLEDFEQIDYWDGRMDWYFKADLIEFEKSEMPKKRDF